MTQLLTQIKAQHEKRTANCLTKKKEKDCGYCDCERTRDVETRVGR